MDYKELRKKYPEFVYKNFSYEMVGEDLVCKFAYEIKPDISFEHEVIVRSVGDRIEKNDHKVLDNLVFNVGLVEMSSYWKSTCSPVIRIEAGYLDDWQIEWWKKLFMNGMMQYFFENNINFQGKDFLKIISSGRKKAFTKAEVDAEKVFVPIGGGKDSAVTLGLIEKSGMEFGTLVIEKASHAAHEIAGLSSGEHIILERKLDLEKIIELNNRGFLNGHIPYSASLYFISLFAGFIFNYKYIAFSNENSSNEGNMKYLGTVVNHQYSKTLEFENDFWEYNEKYLSNIKLFSFLRPLYEVQISKLFTEMNKYFSVIRSCNVGQKEGLWCGKCPKCLSTYILLLPFLGIEKTIGIFGKNLLSDKDLKSLLNDLIDGSNVKPFECVGTRLELRVALNMALSEFEGQALPVLLKFFANSKESKGLQGKTKVYLNAWGKNNLPKEFAEILRFAQNDLSEEIRNIFKEKKIMILGLGREGLSTYRFVRKYLPIIHLTLSDQKNFEELGDDFINITKKDKSAAFVLGDKYIASLQEFDLIIKTPGIPNKFPEIDEAKKAGVKFRSQTDIFLNFFRDKTIGITGTKGKSTTASLIYHVLRESGRKVELVGNIGKPVLDYFDEANEVDDIVFEMSSHQLSDMTISPHIAVFLNIFPEHLDYYKNFEDYLNSKGIITKFQDDMDILIYNANFPEISEIADKSKATKVAFNQLTLPKFTTHLKGEHNFYNIKAGYLVAKKVGLSDFKIVKAIQSFIPLEGRLEKVGSLNGVDYINDTLATIPEATISAINSFPSKEITLILGGFDRGVSFDILGSELAQNKNVKNVILIGQTGGKIKEALLKFNCKNKIYELGTASMNKIVLKASEVTKFGGVVLLSPASTSFDMFKDYKDRGSQFRSAVEKLK